jgi:tetracenomycin A2 monooxygenase-dioxygenase
MAEQAMVRNRIRHGNASPEDHKRMVDDIIITLGYRYRSTAVSNADSTEVLLPSLELRGEPGTRAPHLWLSRAGEKLSTIDLFWDAWVLLVGSQGDGWAKAAELVAERLPVPLRVYRIGSGGDLLDPDRRWPDAYGVTDSGAVLVRPDAFVAWRSAAEQPEPDAVLLDALARMTALPRQWPAS